MEKETCAIIGCGRVGRALAIALKNAGYSISVMKDQNKKVLTFIKKLFPKTLVTSDYKNWPDFDVLIIAVNDDIIESISDELANENIQLNKRVVAHTSGVKTSNILNSLNKNNAYLASMHPVQTFSGAQSDVNKLHNSYFALDGNEKAIKVLNKILEDIGGKSFTIPAEFKPYHHLACVLSSNYITTLMNLAMDLFEPLEIPRNQIKSILLPLMKNAVENMSDQSVASALTGPIVRGDVKTIQEHLNLLKRQKVSWFSTYINLGIETVKLARLQPGISENKLDAIESLLETELVKK